MIINELRAGIRYMPLHSPFVTAKGRSEQARSYVIELLCAEGITGLGAVSPAQYVTGESMEDIERSVPEIGTFIGGRTVDDYEAVFVDLRKAFSLAHAARAGVEMAVMDAWGKAHETPLWRHWGGAKPEVETDQTISLNSLEVAREEAERAVAGGIRQLKIKLDGSYPRDMIHRIRTVHEVAPDAVLLLDANQSFTVNSARAFLEILDREQFPVVLFEQPVDACNVKGLVEVAADSPIPVGADESVVTPDDCRTLLDAGGTQVVNIKLMKSGLSGALDIIRMCRSAGVTLMLGCMVESGIGTGAAVHLACGTGAFTWLDLDAPLLLARDIAVGAYTLNGSIYRVSDAPGLGVQIVPENSSEI